MHDMKITQEMVVSALKSIRRYKFDYHDDVIKIQEVIKEHLNITLSTEDVVDFWKWSSELFAASWLIIHDDEQILRTFVFFVKTNTTNKEEG